MNLLRDLFSRVERMLFAYMRRTGLVLACSDAPDTSGLNRAAEQSSQLGKESLDFFKSVYADQAPYRDQAMSLATRMSDAQLANMGRQSDFADRSLDAYEKATTRQGDLMDKQLGFADRQMALSEGYDKYRKDVFEPLERGIVSDAQTFDTEGKREELAGMALGDVNQSFDSARQQAARSLMRAGINPNDGAYGGTVKQLALSQALAGADAKTKARQQALTVGRAMKNDAAALGRNLPSNQATSAGLAMSGTGGVMGAAGAGAAGAAGNFMAGTQGANASGNLALSSAMMPMNIAGQGAGLVGQGYGQAMQGNQTAGNLYGQAAQLGKSEGTDWLGGLGGLGRGLGALGWAPFASDENEKKSIKPVSGEVALSAVRRMPVKTWKYKGSSQHDDGGVEHTGPMAQDVHAAAGDDAAPGGTSIDPITMQGMTLAAVQQVDRSQRRLEKKVLSLAQAVRG